MLQLLLFPERSLTSQRAAQGILLGSADRSPQSVWLLWAEVAHTLVSVLHSSPGFHSILLN